MKTETGKDFKTSMRSRENYLKPKIFYLKPFASPTKKQELFCKTKVT